MRSFGNVFHWKSREEQRSREEKIEVLLEGRMRA
jgi:hypothetical protein